MDLEKKKQGYYKLKDSQPEICIKDVSTSRRTVTGFYNTMFYVDSDNDVSLPNSFAKSINDRGPNSNAKAKIKHAKDHDLTQVYGVPNVLEERTVQMTVNGQLKNVMGLYFETKLPKTQLGNDSLVNYKEGVIDNHSIGFRYGKLEWLKEGTTEFDKIMSMLLNPEDVKDGGLWGVSEYILHEGSSVAFGANNISSFNGKIN
jgi:phage head maturation protease